MVPLVQHFLFHRCLFDLFLTLNKSVLALSASKSVITLAAKVGSSLHCCHKIPDLFKNYHYILLNNILALLHQYHEHHLLEYCLFC